MNKKLLVAILTGAMLGITAWAWAQQATTPQLPPAGQGTMLAQAPQGGQGAGPGAMMGPRSGQGMHRGTVSVSRGRSLYERPLISEILSVGQQLGLSPDQVQRLETLRTDFEKDAIKRSAEIQVARVDLSSLLEASQPDLSKIESQLKNIADQQAELRFARIKTLREGRSVLSQEQWEKFGSLAPRRGRMGPHGGPWQQGQARPSPSGASGMMGPGMMGMMGGLVGAA